jgi:hypothetical protein
MTDLAQITARENTLAAGRPAQTVQRVLIVSGLDHLIANCPSAEAAIAAGPTAADVPA